MIECQVNYMMSCITEMVQKNYASMEIKQEKATSWSSYIESILPSKVWAGSCKSWYKTEDGRNSTLWPSGCIEYWWGTLLASTTVHRDFVFK